VSKEVEREKIGKVGRARSYTRTREGDREDHTDQSKEERREREREKKARGNEKSETRREIIIEDRKDLRIGDPEVV